MHRRSLLATPLLALPRAAGAETFPSRPLRIIVPFAPGGSGDITARLGGQYIERTAGQPVVVDNRPGANGIIGTMAVKAAAPDGYTLLLATTSSHNANPYLIKDLPYDAAKDFAVVGSFGSGGGYVLVPANSPWRSLAELVAAAKAAPGQVFFGHFNATSQIPGLLLNAMAGIRLQAVPYRAIGAAFSDLLAGRLQVIFVDTAAGDAFIRTGQCRALAHTKARGWSLHPELPAVEESYPGFILSGFLGLAVPAATPLDVQRRLNELANGAITSEPMRSRLLEFGFAPEPVTLEGCATLMQTEIARWGRFVRLAGIEPE